MTLRDFLAKITPRQLVYDLLGVDRTRAHEILRGQPMPAQMVGRIYRLALLPIFGREEALRIVEASLYEWATSAEEWKAREVPVAPEVLGSIASIYAAGNDPALDHADTSAAA